MFKGDAFLGVRVEKCGECSACKGLKKGSGDFTDCMDRIVPAAKPDDPEAFCADYEHRQTGHWPGEKRASIHRDSFLDGPGVESLQKAWSDEARAAAVEARSRNTGSPGEHSGAPADQSTQGGSDTHQAAARHGWERTGPAYDEPGTQEYGHSASGEKIRVKPSGQWSHGAVSGQSHSDLDTYLAHLHGRTQV